VKRKPVTRSIPGFRQTSVRQHRLKAATHVRQTAMTQVFLRVYNHLSTDCLREHGGESVTALAGKAAVLVGRPAGTDGVTDGSAEGAPGSEWSSPTAG
jgi:hypothetical protein